MRGRLTSSRFVGRQPQLAELELAFREASEGRPGLILLGGDSGVGKTRLLAEAEQAFGGALLLRGECLEQGEVELPYAAFLGALRPLVREQDPALDALSAGGRASLATLLPSLGEPARSSSSGLGPDGQMRLFESVVELLHLLSQRQPVVLTIDDMHWADRSTRTLTAFLARSLTVEPVLLLLSYRRDELYRRHPLRPLLAELGRLNHCRVVELEPFDHTELTEALRDILGEQPAPALVERLLARTDGNALYVEELLAASLDGRGPTPLSLREAFLLRIERLSEDARRAAQVVAVGRVLDESTIGSVSHLPEDSLRNALREAVADHILQTNANDKFCFRHALLREALYDDLLPGERGALHLDLARTFEQTDGSGPAEDTGAQVAAAATHYAAAGDQPAALRTTVLAGQRARRLHAYGELVELCDRALELWPRVPDAAAVAGIDHVDLLESASVAYSLVGELRHSELLAQQALEELDPETEPSRYARLLARRGRARWRLNHAADALADARQALGLLPEGPSPERARLLSWIARTDSLRGHYREAIERATSALADARAFELPMTAGETLNTLGMSHIALGEVQIGEAMLRDAIALAREHNDGDDLATAYSNLADLLCLAGRTTDAVAVIDEGQSEARTRFGRAFSWMQLTRSVLLFEAGDWEAAAVLEGPPLTSFEGVALIFRLLRDAELALGRGDATLAHERLRQAEPLVKVTSEAQWHGLFGSLLGEALRRDGELEAAQTAVARALDELEVCTDDVMRIARVTAVGIAVEADRALRARDLRDPATEADATARARIHFDRLEAAAQEGGPVERAWLLTGEAEHSRAQGTNTPALWETAAQAWEALDRPYCGATMRWRQAEALVEVQSRAAAADAAQAALAVADRLGAGWLAGELRGLIARGRLETGAPVTAAEQLNGDAHAATEEIPFGLTPRELQVLSLIAEGASNRQIGAALYMAEKTASVHVSRILTKLGVQSRTQAAALAHRLHLTA